MSAIIDSIVVGLLSLLVVAVALFVAPKEETGLCRNSAGELVTCTPPTDVGRLIILAGLVLAAAMYFFYFAAGVGKRGATPGHGLMKIRIVDVQTGMSIGLGRGMVWALVRFGSFGVLTLGFLWALWSPRKQTWHDMAAKAAAVVVPKR